MTISNTATAVTISGPEQLKTVTIDGKLLDFGLYSTSISDVQAATGLLITFTGVAANNAIYDASGSVAIVTNSNIEFYPIGKFSYTKALTVGNSSKFTLSLGDYMTTGETFLSHTITSTGVTVGLSATNDELKAISVGLTGVDAGRYPVTFDWTYSSGDGDCITVYVDVREC